MEPRLAPRTGFNTCHCVWSHIGASGARGDSPWVCVSVLRWPFCGLPLLPLHFISPTRRIVSRARHSILNSLSIHPSQSSLFRPRATRDLLSNRIAFGQTRVSPPLARRTSYPTPARWLHGILPSGEAYPSHAIFWCGRARAGKRKKQNGVGCCADWITTVGRFHCFAWVW